MKPRKTLLALLLFSFVLSYAQTSEADTTNISERISTIQQMLESSKKNVNILWYGWLGAYSAATVAQGAIAITSNDKATRQDMYLGAGTTLLGAAFQAITPLNTGKDAETLAQMPDSTSELKILKLQAAETFLESNAKKEKEGRSWKIHALNEAVNLGSGLITWLGYKRSVWDGVTNFLINSAVTEIQIWTQPTRTAKDYQLYKQKYLDNNNAQVSLKKPSQTQLLLTTNLTGFSLVLKF